MTRPGPLPAVHSENWAPVRGSGFYILPEAKNELFLPILAWTPADPGVSLRTWGPLSISKQNGPSWNNSGHSGVAGAQGGGGPAAHQLAIPCWL